MFDFDFGKLMVVGIVALAVIPPKDLPRVMRTVGQVVGKMRRMAAEFQGQFMEAMREADLESVRKELEAINDKAKVDAAFDPAAMIRDDMKKAVERPSDIATSTIALDAPEPAPAEPHEADLESVRKELEALNEKAKTKAVEQPTEIGRSEIALNPPPVEAQHPDEAPAKQSAAE
jgi:sec-independent protein translocase protein TatB